MDTVTKQLQVQDTIQELGNIGIGAAATALSALLQQRVLTNTSRLGVIDDAFLLNQKLLEDQVAGILFPYDKDIQGYGLFILEEEFACAIWNSYLHKTVRFADLNKECMAVLQEICSIMISSYLSALASFADINIRVQRPAVSMDMKGSIINDGLSFNLRQEKEAFWLDHELKLAASAKPSHLLLIMNIDSIQNLMAGLEVAI